MLTNYDRLIATTPEDRCRECPACGFVAAELDGHPCDEGDDE